MRQLDEICPYAVCCLCALKRRQEFLRELLLQVEILCSLRLVDLVKDNRIWIVLSRADVKGFHPRLRPNQGKVFAQRFHKFRATLWLNLCFDQHDYLSVCHIYDCSFRFSLAGVFSVWSARTTCGIHAFAMNSAATVAIRIVLISVPFPDTSVMLRPTPKR